MNRSSILIAIIMGVLTLMLWALVNAPDPEPSWPGKVQGFSFSPMRGIKSPEEDMPTPAQIREDVELLAGKVHALRTYTVQGTFGSIPALAEEFDMNVSLGAWISKDVEANKVEIQRLLELYPQHHKNIVRVFVGNEVLLRGDQELPELLKYLKKVKSKVWAPVSTAEPWHIWLKYPELVKQVDFIAVHLLPYWEGVPVDKAVEYAQSRYEQLRQTYPDKPIVIAEVGWPSKGRTHQGAVASQANQAKFLRRFLSEAEIKDYRYYIMEAFDQPWKTSIEGEAGAYWGVYDAERKPKFPFTEPVVMIPEWRGLAVIAITLAVLVLALLFRDSAGLKPRGRGFLAVLVYAITTLAVWIVYDYSHQYMTIASLLVGFFLAIAALGVLLVLLAEAHEWAEALWLKGSRRSPMPRDIMADDELPMVSIHVPAYNEPPEMMMQTLDALAELDYPRFEVLVIDNNTQNEAVWQPVRDHCEKLGPQFRFFHLDPLAGFKAGALNYALRETESEASIVAVIDSDYRVDRNWLRDLVPEFNAPEMAIVQAPQDYRDGDENAFKAMCLAEYRGFFHIGMITRNERNAIIQHGTMTLVRRCVLEEVGGWSEWCITEDAELGLRIFERGYTATYVPRSRGQGLMPDTFIDYKKQRFRWAYGAVLIMREHLSALLGLTKTRLTRGQRYHFVAGWLPWLADGFNLFFNFAAMGWTLGMIWYPEYVAPPDLIFIILPISLFVFKLLKMFFLYRLRVEATLRQSLAAGLAGLALSHVIARAIVTGLITRRVGFYRTPKCKSANALWRSVMDAREELLLMLAMSLAAWVVLQRPDGEMLDIRIWAVVLLIQAVPYAAAVVVSLISAMPGLPASVIGAMGKLNSPSPVATVNEEKSI